MNDDKCPVCWRTVYPSTNGFVFRHDTKIRGDRCPMSGQPFWIVSEYQSEVA